MGFIVIVDDELSIADALSRLFQMHGLEVTTFQNAANAWQYIDEHIDNIDLVITDLVMPEMSGQQLFQKIKNSYPYLPVIVMSGKATASDAVELMKEGVYDFFIKPFENIDKIVLIVKKAIELKEIKKENISLKSKLSESIAFQKIIGKSKKMVEIYETVTQVAPTKASVLITGETGTGKEEIAEAIHKLSGRKGQLVKVNCAALTETLLESELFGHEKGAFTGAIKTRLGRFELANEGTIFLDEIGEVSQNIQVKLLRVLQHKQFERVGGEQPITVDVRIISATNKNLAEKIKEGTFREDLYFRLNVINIHMPPLRERVEDIPLLVKHFIDRFSKEHSKEIVGITPRALRVLMAYSWSGNVRELMNVIENMVILSRDEILDVVHIPSYIMDEISKKPEFSLSDGNQDYETIKIKLGTPLEDIEKIYITQLLQKYKNKAKVAQISGIGRKTLYNKLKKWGMDSGKEEDYQKS